MTPKQPRSMAELHARNIRALELRPNSGKGTATTIARGRPGRVACDISDGARQFVADLGPGQGGEDLGPDPGVLIRAGLAACLVSGYQLWAAHMGITLDDVEVTIATDYDARGMHGVGEGIPPGYLGVRVSVRIASAAPEARVREMVEHADRVSPLLYDFRTALEVVSDVEIVSPPDKGG